MNIALVCMFDDWAIGLRNLAHALLLNGFKPSIVHLKSSSQSVNDTFLTHPINYENIHSNSCTNRFEVTTYNIDATPWSENELALLGDTLSRINPEIIGLSTRSVYSEYLSDFSNEFSKVPDAVTVSGGYDAILSPESHLCFFDYVCLGEGERAIVDLAMMVQGGKSRESIPNICWLEDGEMKRNPLAPPGCYEDFFYAEGYSTIDHYIIEDDQVIHTNDYLSYLQSHSGPTREYYTFAGRGCLNKCAFCAVPKMYEVYSNDGIRLKRRLMRSLDSIIKELTLAKRYGFDTVYIMDSFFVASTDYLKQFFSAIEGLGLHFFAQFLPEQMLSFPELFKMAVDSGLTHTVIGIQSGSPTISSEVFNRPQDYDKILAYAQMVTEYGVNLDYHIITHNPFETEKDLQLALDLVHILPKYNAQIVLQRLTPFKGTAVHDMFVDNNLPMTINDDVYHKRFIFLLFRYMLPDYIFTMFYAEACDSTFDYIKTVLYPKYAIYRRDALRSPDMAIKEDPNLKDTSQAVKADSISIPRKVINRIKRLFC